jgi:hypothetical protein
MLLRNKYNLKKPKDFRVSEGQGYPRVYIYIFIYNILSLSGGRRPFHPSVPSSSSSSIHPSFSSQKKKMMEEEEDNDEWRQQQFIQMFM